MFHSNIISIDGEKGKAWLAELPELVGAISSELDLCGLKEVTNLSYNYVLSGFQENNPIILKLGLDNEALMREAFALKSFADCGAVKVLAKDKGMLLLERAVPATPLKSYFPGKEQESIEIAKRSQCGRDYPKSYRLFCHSSCITTRADHELVFCAGSSCMGMGNRGWL